MSLPATSQLLLSFLITFIIFRTYIAYKKQNLSEGFVFIWGAFWIGILVLIFKKDLVSEIAHKLGISRGVDLVIYFSLIATFYMIYRILVLIDGLDRKITELVRKIALKDEATRKKSNTRLHRQS